MNDTQPGHKDEKPVSFGTRLKNAREAMGVERGEVAQYLRLNEKIISMMERERYPIDLPVTFIRGYIRAYCKYLSIPEFEVRKALEPIKAKNPTNNLPVIKPIATLDQADGNFLRMLTFVTFLTLFCFLTMWWYGSGRMLGFPKLAKNTATPTSEIQQTRINNSIEPTNWENVLKQPMPHTRMASNQNQAELQENKNETEALDLYN